jgi:hypothetical protein
MYVAYLIVSILGGTALIIYGATNGIYPFVANEFFSASYSHDAIATPMVVLLLGILIFAGPFMDRSMR